MHENNISSTNPDKTAHMRVMYHDIELKSRFYNDGVCLQMYTILKILMKNVRNCVYYQSKIDFVIKCLQVRDS